jgi:hypothetical protein
MRLASETTQDQALIQAIKRRKEGDTELRKKNKTFEGLVEE